MVCGWVVINFVCWVLLYGSLVFGYYVLFDCIVGVVICVVGVFFDVIVVGIVIGDIRLIDDVVL